MSYTQTRRKSLSQSDDSLRDVIDSYTDREAVEDVFSQRSTDSVGVNRVTSAVFNHFAQEMGPGVTNITALMNVLR